MIPAPPPVKIPKTFKKPIVLSRLKLLGNRTVVKILPFESEKDGIVLPDRYSRNEDYAEIILIAEGADVPFKVGDTVLMNRLPMPDHRIDVGDDEYKVIDSPDEMYFPIAYQFS